MKIPFLLAIVASTAMPLRALAVQVYDDQRGQAKDVLRDFQGVDLALSAGVVNDSVAGLVRLETVGTSGTLVTNAFIPASAGAWKKVFLKYQAPSLGNLALSVLDADGTPIAAFPLAPTSEPGFNAEANIASIDFDAHPSLRLAVTLNGVNAAFAPVLDDLQVTWQPYSLLSVDALSPSSACANDTFTIDIPVAVNHIRAEGLTIKVDAPTLSNLTHAANAPTVVTVSAGGQQNTGAPLLLGDVLVAHDDVYWHFAQPVAAGSSFVLSVTYRVPFAIDHNATVQTRVTAGASNANPITTSDLVVTATSAPHLAINTDYTTIYRTAASVFANPGDTVTAQVTVANQGSGANRCDQSAHDLLIVDDLSNFRINGNLELRGAPTGISDGGHFVAVGATETIGTQTISGPAVVWTYDLLLPSSDHTFTYSLPTQPRSPAGTHGSDGSANRTATVRSRFDNTSATHTRPLVIGLPAEPNGAFGVGQAFRYSRELNASRDDLPTLLVPGSESFSYTVTYVNRGLSDLRGVFVFVQLPASVDFVDVIAPNSAEVFYSADTSPSTTTYPPDYYQDSLGGTWTNDPDLLGAPVRWVAFKTDLDSPIFGTGLPTQLDAEVLVASSAASGCTTAEHTARGFARPAYYVAPGTNWNSWNNDSSLARDDEIARTASEQPRIHEFGVARDLAVRTGAGPVTYTFKVANDGPAADPIDTARQVELEINLPQVPLATGSGYLPVIGLDPAGGVLDSSDQANGRLFVRWATLPARTTRNVTLTLFWPRGGLDGSVANLVANLTMEDDLCAPQSAGASTSTELDVRPALSVRKLASLDHADPGGHLAYTIQVDNTGDGSARDAIIFDRIPTGLALDRIRDPGYGGRVWVSNAQPPALPVGFTNLAQFNRALIDQGLFVLATQVAPGEWTTPFGANTTWIAVELDDPSLTPPRFPTGVTAAIGLDVTVGPLSAQSIVTNRAAVDAADILAAVGNGARTTISNQPVARSIRTIPTDVASGETFTYTIALSNSGTVPASAFTYSETLPVGFQVVSSQFAWNDTSPFGTTPTPTTSLDGQTLTWDLGAAAGTLGSLQGGTITLVVAVDPSIPTNTTLDVTGASTIANVNNTTGVTSTDAATVTVSAADLAVAATASNLAPIGGDRVTLRVTIENTDRLDAAHTGFTVRVPVGVSFVPDSAFATTPGFALTPNSGPVSTPVYDVDSQLVAYDLTWTDALTSATSPTPGLVPGSSGPIYVDLQLDIAPTVPPTTDLPVTVSVHTTSGQGDNANPDTTVVPLRTPAADPFITLLAPTFVRPSDIVAVSVTYGNDSRQSAGPTAFVIEVPHLDATLTSSLVNATVRPGDTLYYRSGTAGEATPAFDPNDPTSNGWTTDRASLTGPLTHLAIYTPSLEADARRQATLRFDFADPVTDTLVAGGTRPELCLAALTLGADDDDTSNNTPCHTFKVPVGNLSASLTGSPTGAYPGVAVGANVSLTAKVAAAGLTPSYGTWFELDPGLLTNPSALPQFVTLVDALGQPSTALSPSGEPIATAIPLTHLGNRYYLGTLGGTADPLDYHNIGLRPGDTFAFALTATVGNTITDGTQLTATLRVGTDYRFGFTPDQNNAEDPSDNLATFDVTARRPDLKVALSATDLSGTTDPVSPGDRIRWNVEYDNIGSISANSAQFTSLVAPGTSFVIGSVANPPAGSTLQYLGPSGWGYTPSGGVGTVDPQVRGVRVVTTSLPSSASPAFRLTPAELAQGVTASTTFEDGRVVAGLPDGATWTSPVLTAPAGAVQWTNLILEGSEGSAPIRATVLDAATQLPIPGFEDVPLDASGMLDLSAISITAHPTLQVTTTFGASAPGHAGPSGCDLSSGTVIDLDFGPGGVYGEQRYMAGQTVIGWAFNVNVGGYRALLWTPNGGGPGGWGAETLPTPPSTNNAYGLGLNEDATIAYGRGDNGTVSWVKEPDGTWTPHDLTVELGLYPFAIYGYYPPTEDNFDSNEARQPYMRITYMGQSAAAYFDKTSPNGLRLLYAPGQSIQRVSLQTATGSPIAMYRNATAIHILEYVDGALTDTEMACPDCWINDLSATQPQMVGYYYDADLSLQIGFIIEKVAGTWTRTPIPGLAYGTLISNDGAVFGTTQIDYKYAFARRVAGTWFTDRLSGEVDGLLPGGNTSASWSDNHESIRDGFLIGNVYEPWQENVPQHRRPVVWSASAPVGLPIPGTPLGAVDQNFDMSSYMSPGLVFGRLLDSNYTLVGHRYHKQEADGSWTEHVMAHEVYETYYGFPATQQTRDARLSTYTYANYGIMVWTDDGPLFREVNASPYPTANIKVYPHAEGGLYGYWAMQKLYGCFASSDASFTGLAVGYRAGQNPAFSYETQVLADTCQDALTTQVSATSASVDNDPSNDTASASIALRRADLRVTLTTSHSVATNGTAVTWTADVKNLGPYPATATSLTVSAPGLTTPMPISLGTLAPGQAATQTFTVTLTGLADNEVIAAAAFATATEPDCDENDSFASVTTIISDTPNVWVALATPALALVGQPFAATVHYGNDSATPSDAGTVTLTLPAGLTLASGATTVAVPALAPGEGGTLEVILVGDATLLGATTALTATLATPSDLLAGDNVAVAPVTFQDGGGQLSVTLVADRGAIAVGERATFTAFFDNRGLSAADDTTLTIQVPSGVTLDLASLAASDQTPTWNPTTRTLLYDLGELAPSAHGAVSFAVVGDTEGTVSATAVIDALADVSPNNTSSASLAINDDALRVTASVDHASTVNGSLGWTVVVTNDTSAPVSTTFTQPISSGLTYLPGSIEGPGANASNPTALTWDLVLAPGESKTLSYATSAPTTAGPIGLTASTAGTTSNTAASMAAPSGMPTLVSTWTADWVVPGELIQVTIHYDNPGPALTGATLFQSVDPELAIVTLGGATNVPGTTPTLRWDLGNLAAGANGSVTFTLQVATGAEGQLVLDRARLVSLGAPPQLSNTLVTVALECVDDNVCTGPGEASENVGCVFPPVVDGSPCDDGLGCTRDTCIAGECAALGQIDCGDDNPCTTDTCTEGQGCVHDAVVCDDGLDCTIDSCDPTLGCVFTPNDAACGGGTECAQLTCAPSDPIHDAQGCVATPINDWQNCNSDANLCTYELCVGGQCTYFFTDTCNDGNPCTSDPNACDPTLGCVYADPCDDNNTCTHDSCTADWDLELPICDHNAAANNGLACDTDSDVCTLEVCSDGACNFSATETCVDGDPCTVDPLTCDPQGGCVYTSPCDDGIACTADSCTPSEDFTQPICQSTAVDAFCGGDGLCATAQCAPTDPSADAAGCVVTPQPNGTVIVADVECGNTVCGGATTGNIYCENGTAVSSCDQAFTEVPDTTCTAGVTVAYAIAYDGQRPVGTIRCLQAADGTTSCDEDAPGELKVYDGLFCPGISGGTP